MIVVALDDHARLDAQPHVAVARVVVEPADDRAVGPVRDLLDLLAEHPLGVVHPVVRGAHHDLGAVALDEAEEPLLPELAGGEHRVHVAAVHRLGPDVVEDHPVEVLVQRPALVPAQRVVHLRLGVDVERVRVDPGEGTADVEHVRSHGRVAEQLALVEDRHRDRDVRRVRGAEVRVVVDDHVAVLDLAVEPVQEAADVPGQRADVHRRRVRLAQLASLGVEDPGAEVLGLADDRRVAHPEEHARHLLGDRVERAAEDAQRDRVDLDALPGGRPGPAADLVLGDAHNTSLTVPGTVRSSASATTSVPMTMFPKRSIRAVSPGGITVVESYWLTIAGPSSRLPAFSSARS